MAKEINTEKQAEVVAEAVSKTELFFQENKKNIITVLAVLVIAGAAFFAWHRFAYLPQVEEAQEQMLVAEASFLAQEYELALNGNESAAGFAEIISEYGNKAGAAANLYAGICEFHLGNFDSAISYLEAYKGTDAILAARAIAAIGDCYVAKEDYKKAVTYFEKAAAHQDNMYAATYLLKAGVTYEELGQADKALACYKKIKDQYEQSLESYEIDKYISRIENK
jgi:tetratricopeptide (TPR) repeat protein